MPNPVAGPAFKINAADIRLSGDASLDVDPNDGGLRAKPGMPPNFTGLLARDFDAGSVSYAPGYTTIASYDAGASGVLLPLRWELPIAIGLVRPVVAVVFHGGGEWLDENLSAVVPLLRTFQDIADALLGGAQQGAQRDGSSIRKLEFRANNTGGISNVADFGPCRMRCAVLPRGVGVVP